MTSENCTLLVISIDESDIRELCRVEPGSIGDDEEIRKIMRNLQAGYGGEGELHSRLGKSSIRHG